MEDLSRKVRELRGKLQLSQEDLARYIDVSLSTIQRWEGRGGKPTRLARSVLLRLFKRYGIK